MNTTGYFFDGSKFGGLTIQYCTGVPPAPGTVALSGVVMATLRSHDSFMRVSNCGAPPAIGVRATSAGAVKDAFENTRFEALALTALIAPPFTISLGVPPASGT